MKSAQVKMLAKYLLGLGLLAYVVYANWEGNPGLSDILQRPVNWLYLLISFAVCAISVQLIFVRWYLLVQAQDLPFDLHSAFRLGLIGYYFNTFLPGQVGGDLIKAYGIAREQSRRTVAVATVLIDRGIGLWGLIWFVTLLGGGFWLAGNPVIANNEGLRYIIRTCAGIITFTLLVWAFLGVLPQRRADRFARRLRWIPKLGGPLAEFWYAVWMYRKRGMVVLTALAISFCCHCGFVLTFYLAARTFEPPEGTHQVPSLTQTFVIVPVGMTFQALFPSPGGVGGGEAGFGYLFELVGCPPANGVATSLTQRLVTWCLALVGYLVYVRMKATNPNLGAEPSAEPAPAPA